MSRITLLLAAGVFVACNEPKPVFEAPLRLGDITVPADTLNRGHEIYMKFCVSCHAPDGSGQGPASRGLKARPRDFRTAAFEYKTTPGDHLPTDDDLRRTILKGVVDEGMPPFQMLMDDDVDAVIQFIKTFSPRWQEVPAGRDGPPAR